MVIGGGAVLSLIGLGCLPGLVPHTRQRRSWNGSGSSGLHGRRETLPETNRGRTMLTHSHQLDWWVQQLFESLQRVVNRVQHTVTVSEFRADGG